MDPVDLRVQPVFIAHRVDEYPYPPHGRIFVAREQDGGCSFYTNIWNIEVARDADRDRNLEILRERLAELMGGATGST